MSIGIVTTRFGKLSGVPAEGERYGSITTFKGIPYAAPPVGNLRWAPPQDPEPWEGVRACDTFGPRAVQQMGEGPGFEPYASDFYYMGHPPMSEDCLYLNVTTGAASADEKRPVYIWFHGGGLATGYSYEVEFNPLELAKKGIIVVTVGQRLNIFGYLTLPQLSAEQGGRSGNYGLMDEVKALDWVYENIAAFGGDPENITVGGQSGGTWKSGALAASPMQKGRVKRVINQSGLCWLRKIPSMEEEQKNAAAYLEMIGISPDASLEELRKVPAEKFFSSREPFAPGPRMPSEMVVDGVYLPSGDFPALIAQNAGSCDYLTGGNYGETRMTANFFDRTPMDTPEAVKAQAKKLLGDLYEAYDFESLVSFTGKNPDHVARWLGSLGISGAPMLGNLAIERIFGAERAKANPAAKTYVYLFDHITPTRPEDKGTGRDADMLLAWHSSELWYTFASLRENVPPCRPWTQLDFKLADQLSSYWANFIATGNPDGEGLPHWPACGEKRGWMELGDSLVSHDGLEGKLDEMVMKYAEEVVKKQ